MPSSSYSKFIKNMETVKRLENTYYESKKVNHNKGGRGAFDHLTRGAVVFLVSSFEVYCENILMESCEHLIKNAKDAKYLPHAVRSTISDFVKCDSNGIPPTELCDEGWRAVYKGIVQKETDRLNTPSTKNLEKLFAKLLGVKKGFIENIVCDTLGTDRLDPIIVFRGEITHRVRANRYVHIEIVKEYEDTILNIVVSIDKKVCDYIKGTSLSKKQPWKKTYR